MVVARLLLCVVQLAAAGSNLQTGCADTSFGQICHDGSVLLQGHLHVSPPEGKPVTDSGSLQARQPLSKSDPRSVIDESTPGSFGSDPEGYFLFRGLQLAESKLEQLHFNTRIVWALAAATILVSLIWTRFFELRFAVNLLLFVVYILWSSTILFTSKHLVHQGQFVHPVLLVTLHMLACSVFSGALYYSRPQWFPSIQEMQAMPSEEYRAAYRALASIAGCFAFSLVCENTAYFYSSVAFLQMIKETGLICVFAFCVVAGLDACSFKKLGYVMLILVGACMCVRGEMHFTPWGLCSQIISNVCNATRLTLQAKLLVFGVGVKLDPLSYMVLVTPLCLGALLVPSVAVFWHQPSTLAALRSSSGILILSCMLAVGLNLLVSVVVQRVSAMGFCLLGCMKNVVVVLVCFGALGQETSMCQICGCIMISSSVVGYVILKQSDTTQSELTKLGEDESVKK